MQFNRSIGGGITHQHMIRLAALDGVYLDSDSNNMCTALVDAHDAGLKKGLDKDLVAKARANAAKSPSTPIGFAALFFSVGTRGDVTVDDTNAEFYASDLFTPQKNDKKMIADSSNLPVPPLPGLESIPDLSIPPLPEPVAPEPEKIKPAPLPQIVDDVPPPPPEDEVLPKQNKEVELPAPPPPQRPRRQGR